MCLHTTIQKFVVDNILLYFWKKSPVNTVIFKL